MKCIICKKQINGKFKRLTTPLEKLMQSVRVSPRCWAWAGAKDGYGYGRISMHRGHVEKAHRLAYILSGRKLSGRDQVLHSCDNPPCVRPSHLFKGNHLLNMRDMFSKGRRVAAVGRRNARAKLTLDQVRTIRKMYSRGVGSIKTISEELKLNVNSVRGVLVGRQWKWVRCPKLVAEKIKRRLSQHNAWSFRGRSSK